MKDFYLPSEALIQEEIIFVTKVITHPAGYDLDLFGTMCVRPTDQLIWEVDWEESIDGKRVEKYKEFPTAKEAAEFFVHKRYEIQLGEDVESYFYHKSKQE